MSKRPPPADSNLVASFAQAGPIGQCLKNALDDLVSDNFVQQVEQEAQQQSSDTTEENNEITAQQEQVPTFDSDMAEKVMRSFGRAVAQSDWNDCPAALVRGRVDHYNKMDQKWRIVVQDAELCPREEAPIQTSDGKPRKKQKLSLWEESESNSQQQESISLDGSLQILAYNDS